MFRGFTLIELIVALAIIALLLSVAAPNYLGGLARADEAALRENLYVMRDAIDKHFADTGRYPASLDELAAKRYLRAIPVDPITGKASWVAVPPQEGHAGVYDVRTAAKGSGRDGVPYEKW